MNTSSLLLLLALAAIMVYFLWAFLMLLLRQARSPLRHLPGPPSPSFFMGNLREMHDQENNGLVARWAATYGSTFVYRGFIGGCRLMTIDPLAVNHIMSRGYDYPKPDFVRDSLASMAAGYEGLLTAEGEMHRKQRKILNPAFSATQIRSLSPVFWQKAIRLRDIWLDISTSSKAFFTPVDPFALAEVPFNSSDTDPEPATAPKLSPSAVTTSFLPNPFASFTPSKASQTIPSLRSRQPDISDDAPCRLDVLPWLARATLDVIGEAGFGYAFNSLNAAAERRDSESELAQAFGVIFSTARKFRVTTILQVWFPVLRKFQRENAAMQQAQATMHKIGTELIEHRRAAVAAGLDISSEKRNTIEGDKTAFDRDLLSVLVRSNLSENPAQRMSMNELLCQISTFLAAGHETTASALTWTLYALARCPASQNKLRAELRSVLTPPSLNGPVSFSMPSHIAAPKPPCIPISTPPSTPADAAAAYDPSLSDRIAQLPYLDAVVREALRLYAPITTTMRVATQDDVVPISAPYTDRRGRLCSEIHVRKGDIISVPIQAMNKGAEAWGEDANVFRPERWEEARHREPELDGTGEGAEKGKRRTRHVQGLWGNMLTFGGGNSVNGNRSCIGYRFALSEIKIFLFVLLRDIEFSEDPAVEIEKKVNVVTRPCVKSEPHRGNQMPLYIRRIPRCPVSNPELAKD